MAVIDFFLAKDIIVIARELLSKHFKSINFKGSSGQFTLLQ